MATFSVTVDEYDTAGLASHCGGPEWTLDPGRAALLVHDAQPYYLNVLAPGVRARLLTALDSALAWADHHQVPVLASAPRPARMADQRGLLGSLWGLGPDAGQVREVALERLREDDVTWIAKRSYSAYYASDLEAELRRTRRAQLVVVGVYASAGITATSLDAFARDTKVFVPVDATADYTARHHARGLDLVAALSGRVIATIG
ncbi:isochorismatase family protein [Streptomyces vinaceus]|uniref:isochorismatase family protein n=1 Tax=Streptomyces vinaceus TaxID=1960 RepID=UPI0038069E03